MNNVSNDPNTYDFDFQLDNDEEFDPDNDPILNGFMEILSGAVEKEKHETPKTRIPNPEKLAEVTKAFKILTKVIKEEHSNAIFKYELNDWLYDDNEKFEGNNIFVSGCPSMIIESSYLSLKIQKCISNLSLITNIDIDALTTGGVRVTIEFSNIYDTFIEKPRT